MHPPSVNSSASHPSSGCRGNPWDALAVGWYVLGRAQLLEPGSMPGGGDLGRKLEALQELHICKLKHLGIEVLSFMLFMY